MSITNSPLIASKNDVHKNSTFTCRNCGGGGRGRVAIYRPFGELRRAKIVLSPVWCSRPTTGVLLAHATMNFVGLDLTTSDRITNTGKVVGDGHRYLEPMSKEEEEDDDCAGIPLS
ncbi:hypothetical protein TNCV_39661 [Trichonephila clavipes]|nr:hypothetical protein TNCV_39661 [Trichonephila clavipes]